MTSPRVTCFIDGGNLFGRLRAVFGSGKVHLPTLCQLLAGSTRTF